MTNEVVTCEQVFKDWKTLNKYVSEMNEQELLILLNYELAGKRRPTYITRIHERYTRLRANRERQGMFNGMIDQLGV